MKPAEAAAAKAALLKYLQNGRPLIQLVHRGGLHPSRKDLRAPKPTGTTLRAPANATSASSYNWSGFATTSTTAQAYSGISAHWAVPTLKCNDEQRLESDWVGLDGYNTGTVEQVGTLGWCFQGQPLYYTWYEMYPSATATVGTTVQPGDQIAASISRSGTNYNFSLTDSTTSGNNVSASQSCAATTCLDESAEWIHERPSFSIGVAPQARSTVWHPWGGAVTVSGTTDAISGAPNLTMLTMVDATGNYPLTYVNLRTAKSFTVKTLNTY